MAQVDKEKMNQAFEAFMKNPAWKKRYDDAPSEACKDYWKYIFYYSKFFDPDADDADEFDEIQEEYAKKLSLEDWEYMKVSTGNGPFRKVCNDKIRELQAK